VVVLPVAGWLCVRMVCALCWCESSPSFDVAGTEVVCPYLFAGVYCYKLICYFLSNEQITCMPYSFQIIL
jgi:hypothetical protein